MLLWLLDHKHLAFRHRFFHLNQSKMFDDIFDKVFKKYVQTDSFRLPMCVKAGHTFTQPLPVYVYCRYLDSRQAQWAPMK